MTNQNRKLNDETFDLEERTALFGEMVIRLAKQVPASVTTNPLIAQLIRAGTNYCEANDAESRKDFRHKIGLCRKESHETKYWLRIVAVAEPAVKEEARRIWQEAKELNLIFGAIRRKT